ncbi:MAG: hypothetical protein ABSD74_11965 [Rhizomicrobium sp.]|jgi:hypothetical protein
MRVGAVSFASLLLTLVASHAAFADGIIRIVNASASAVTVRIDGTFGCRAPAKPAASTDIDMPTVCSFGAADGSHTLDVHYDDGTASSRAVTITPAGLKLTLTGKE